MAGQAETVGTSTAWVRTAREAAGMTQAFLAAAMTERGHAGWQQSAVVRIENDQRRIKPDELADLVDVLSVGVQERARHGAPGMVLEVDVATVATLARLVAEAEQVETALQVEGETVSRFATLAVEDVEDARRERDARLVELDERIDELAGFAAELEAEVEDIGVRHRAAMDQTAQVRRAWRVASIAIGQTP